jgi:hypothetical protein
MLYCPRLSALETFDGFLYLRYRKPLLHFRFCVRTVHPVPVSLSNVIFWTVVRRPLKLKGDLPILNVT